jgi:hypothetical protein
MCTDQNVIYERTERISTFIMKDVTMVNVELSCSCEKGLKVLYFLLFALLVVNLYIDERSGKIMDPHRPILLSGNCFFLEYTVYEPVVEITRKYRSK